MTAARRYWLAPSFFASFPMALAGCGASQVPTDTPPDEAAPLERPIEKEEKAAAETTSSGPDLPWAPATYSPRPGSTPDPELLGAEEACGKGDAALHDVAQFVAQLHADEGQAPNLDVVKFHMRRKGSPYVMPRLWSAAMSGIDEKQITDSIEKWASAREPLGEFRCGLGLAKTKDGGYVATALQTDVLAEVKPVPTEVESGTWLDFEATLLAPTSSATVLLLPPEGRPRHLDTKLEGGEAKARFSIETEGTWLIQLMATQTGGPRPVAQMLVTADEQPPSRRDSSPVPGESAFDADARPADALFQLINAARKDQGLPTVERNRTLDRAAEQHNQAMIEQGRISHDTGAGDPAYRIGLLGIHPKATGENVALAGSVVRLHRVVWASPAHRENLLLRRWDEAGVAVVDDGEGALYATQLFIDSN